MEVPNCPVCHRHTSGVVMFADYRQLPPGFVGRPNGFAYFCREHLQAAQQLSHLPSYQAIRMIKQSQQRQQPFSANMPREIVAFKRAKVNFVRLRPIFLLFTFFPLVMIVVYFQEIPDYLMPYGKIMFGRLAFLLFVFLVVALTGYSNYRAFMLHISKKPRLTLDSEGFVDLSVGERILWRDISEIEIMQNPGVHSPFVRFLIRLTLKETSEFKRNTFVLKRMFNKINPFGCDVVIDVEWLDSPALNVFVQFKDYYSRFGNLR